MPPVDHAWLTQHTRPDRAIYFDPMIAQSLVRAGVPHALRAKAACCDLEAAQEAADGLADAIDTIAHGRPYRRSALAHALGQPRSARA